MKKNTKPSQRDIRLCVETIFEPYEAKKTDIDDAIKGIDEMIEESYEAGHDDGYESGQEDYEEENPAINEEKLCTEYVVEKFGECVTLDDFTAVYNELRNLSYTHMV